MRRLFCILLFICFFIAGINPASAGIFKKKSKNKKNKESVEFKLLEENVQTPSKTFYIEERPTERVYGQSSFKISMINPTVSTPGAAVSYPGLRGANMLVVYTPTYGIKTGTNEFGAEAVVVNNIVVKLSGADSLIPRNGFVISGHGTAKKWIQDNLILGTKIQLDEENMRVSALITDETYIYEIKEKIKETESVINYYINTVSRYDYRKSASLLSRAKDFVNKAIKYPEKSIFYLERAKETVDLALKSAIPYNSNEFKGIWIRPVETNPYEIQRTVEKLYETGIKNVFLETFYHGKTIYPSNVLKNYGVNFQKQEFTGFDPLRVWIEECHKRNMKLHVWFECFYVGNTNPQSDSNHILSVYPEWANTTKALADSDKLAYSTAEHNGYFIDPANPDVQTFVTDVLKEIVDKYHPDGINLDYIRYPQCAYIQNENSIGTEWGYTKYARSDFENLYGIDPVEITFNDPLRQKWFEYRQKKITDLVEKARKITYAKNITLTTVIFPDRKRSCATKLQDWKTWSDRHLIDGFTPLLLTTDINTAKSLLREIQICSDSNVSIYPGLFVMFMNASPSELLLQIHGMRRMNTNGIIFFDYAHLYSKYIEALTERVFNPRG